MPCRPVTSPAPQAFHYPEFRQRCAWTICASVAMRTAALLRNPIENRDRRFADLTA
jgi:hypothetical protein